MTNSLLQTTNITGQQHIGNSTQRYDNVKNRCRVCVAWLLATGVVTEKLEQGSLVARNRGCYRKIGAR
ncbi:TPA: hypothetical protein ACPSKB_000924 [Legionella feeleii]